jgi:hypothetical protein
VRAEHLLLACLVAAVIAFGSSAYATVRFCFRLKRHEADTWRHLGSPMPTLDRPKAMADFVATRRFIRSGDHRALRDSKSTRLGDLVAFTDRLLLVVAFVASAIAGYIVVFVAP